MTWDNPAVIGLLIAVPSFVLGLLGYLRSRKVDEVAEQSGAASQDINKVGQVIDGLNSLVTSLQDDNKTLRQEIEGLRSRLAELRASYEKMEGEIDALKNAWRSASASDTS